jgi:hypothetical protein
MSRNRQNTASTEKWSSKGLELDPKSRDVKAEEVCVGSIVWLRQRRSNEEEITCVREGHCSDDFKLLDNGYRHPVVILKIWQRSGSTQPGDLMLGVSDVGCYQARSLTKCTLHFPEMTITMPSDLGILSFTTHELQMDEVVSETKQEKANN